MAKTKNENRNDQQEAPSGPKKRRPTAWKPGQSGNPKGRPKSGESLAEALRGAVSPKALLDRMKWLADHAESETVRFHAISWLAERGWGKAPQVVTVNEGNPYARR
jgi:hypothetical protein